MIIGFRESASFGSILIISSQLVPVIFGNLSYIVIPFVWGLVQKILSYLVSAPSLVRVWDRGSRCSCFWGAGHSVPRSSSEPWLGVQAGLSLWWK